jgi:hypothetical protein
MADWRLRGTHISRHENDRSITLVFTCNEPNIEPAIPFGATAETIRQEMDEVQERILLLVSDDLERMAQLAMIGTAINHEST